MDTIKHINLILPTGKNVPPFKTVNQQMDEAKVADIQLSSCTTCGTIGSTRVDLKEFPEGTKIQVDFTCVRCSTNNTANVTVQPTVYRAKL